MYFIAERCLLHTWMPHEMGKFVSIFSDRIASQNNSVYNFLTDNFFFCWFCWKYTKWIHLTWIYPTNSLMCLPKLFTWACWKKIGTTNLGSLSVYMSYHTIQLRSAEHVTAIFCCVIYRKSSLFFLMSASLF